MNSAKIKNNRGLEHYEYAGGYISYDPAHLTEHYEAKGFKGNNRKDSNKSESK